MHRVLLFQGQPYEIYSYGFFLVLSMAVGLWWSLRRGPRFGMTRDQVLDFDLALLLGGMIGARAYSVFYDWDLYAHEPLYQLVNIRSGGLAWHGGILGGIIGFVVYRYRSGIEAGRLIDMAMPCAILSHVIGRIGCFLNGCCVGRVTTVPWAVTFPDAPEWHCVPRHPCQLYEAGAEILILLFVLFWWERHVKRQGLLLYLYLALYGAARFVVEYFRDDPVVAMGLDVSQFISIGMITIGVCGLLWRPRSSEVPTPTQNVEVRPDGA